MNQHRREPLTAVLHLQIDYDNASLARVIDAQQRFLALIREVARERTSQDNPVAWIVAAVREGTHGGRGRRRLRHLCWH